MEEIVTKDIFRSAHLLCMGGHLRKTKLVRNQHILFVIQGHGLELEDQRYRTGQALVNPLQLREALNLLRDLVFEKKAHFKERKRHDNIEQTGNRADQAKRGSASPRRVEGHSNEKTRSGVEGAVPVS